MFITLHSPKYGNKNVYFDDCDYELVKSRKWLLVFMRGLWYCVSSGPRNKGSRKWVKIHRLIMGVTDPNIFIDHADGDGLNNRRSNLRVATNSQNTANSSPSIKNKTWYRGVSINSGRLRYRVDLVCNGERFYGGCFDSLIDAAKKYNELAISKFGQFAFLNKIPDK